VNFRRATIFANHVYPGSGRLNRKIYSCISLGRKSRNFITEGRAEPGRLPGSEETTDKDIAYSERISRQVTALDKG
jgi:hypothetical protein